MRIRCRVRPVSAKMNPIRKKEKIMVDLQLLLGRCIFYGYSRCIFYGYSLYGKWIN